nr:hypothetical protein [Microbispora sp. H13382]
MWTSTASAPSCAAVAPAPPATLASSTTPSPVFGEADSQISTGQPTNHSDDARCGAAGASAWVMTDASRWEARCRSPTAAGKIGLTAEPSGAWMVTGSIDPSLNGTSSGSRHLIA